MESNHKPVVLDATSKVDDGLSTDHDLDSHFTMQITVEKLKEKNKERKKKKLSKTRIKNTQKITPVSSGQVQWVSSRQQTWWQKSFASENCDHIHRVAPNESIRGMHIYAYQSPNPANCTPRKLTRHASHHTSAVQVMVTPGPSPLYFIWNDSLQLLYKLW